MKLITVDAFTNQPFSGNPAAVCISEKPLEQELMQKVANELNLAETAFLYPKEEGFHLRWFTPEVEVRLCGHATLASAHVLWEENYLKKEETAVFHTLSGELTAKNSDGYISLNFPAIFTEEKRPENFLLDGLQEDVQHASYNDNGYWIIEVENEEIVRRMKPDMIALAKSNGLVIVTGKSSTDEFDFVSRVFAPAYGIDEDPVTGAAHCALTPYWNKRTGKREFKAFQASKRGGKLFLKLEGERVILTGQAVTVSEIKLLV